MATNVLPLWLTLLAYQCVRFATVAGVAASDWQSWVLWFVIALMFVDMFVVQWLFRRLGFQTGDSAFVPLGRRDPHGSALLGLILYFCATPFCASVVMLKDTSVVIAGGPPVGPISINEAKLHPDAKVFEIDDGLLKTHLQGAVKYSMSRRVVQYFYAVPFVTKGWTVDQPVSVWAILGEGDMTASDIHNRRFGVVVPHRSMHYTAFTKAVANAEQRSALRSAPDAIFVRLSASAPAAATWMSSEYVWMGIICLSTWLLTLPYAIRLFSPEPSIESKTNASDGERHVETLANETSIADAIHGPNVTDDWPVAPSDSRRPVSQTRCFWFLMHFGILTAATLFILKSTSTLMCFVAALFAIFMEVWMLRQSFQAQCRTPRFGCLVVVLPITMALGMLFVGIGTEKFATARRLSQAPQIELSDLQIPPDTRFVEFTGDRRLRDDLAGYFYAPNSDASTWWIVPVVPADWTPATPVRVWMQTTNRTREKDLEGELHYAQVLRQPLGLRTQSALDDAVHYFKLTSAPDAIFVTRMHEVKEQNDEAGGMIVLAVFFCLLGWIGCACYWPKGTIRSE